LEELKRPVNTNWENKSGRCFLSVVLVDTRSTLWYKLNSKIGWLNIAISYVALSVKERLKLRKNPKN
jgi:hypothetical protein